MKREKSWENAVEKDRSDGPENGVLPQGAQREQLSATGCGLRITVYGLRLKRLRVDRQWPTSVLKAQTYPIGSLSLGRQRHRMGHNNGFRTALDVICPRNYSRPFMKKTPRFVLPLTLLILLAFPYVSPAPIIYREGEGFSPGDLGDIEIKR